MSEDLVCNVEEYQEKRNNNKGGLCRQQLLTGLFGLRCFLALLLSVVTILSAATANDVQRRCLFLVDDGLPSNLLYETIEMLSGTKSVVHALGGASPSTVDSVYATLCKSTNSSIPATPSETAEVYNVTNLDHFTSSDMPAAALRSLSQNASSTQSLVFFLGLSAPWVISALNWTTVVLPEVHRGAYYMVIPARASFQVWARQGGLGETLAAASSLSTVLKATLQSGRLYVLDSDPFAVGALNGLAAAYGVFAAVGSNTTSFKALALSYEDGESRCAASGFANSVQVACPSCQVELLEVERDSYRASNGSHLSALIAASVRRYPQFSTATESTAPWLVFAPSVSSSGSTSCDQLEAAAAGFQPSLGGLFPTWVLSEQFCPGSFPGSAAWTSVLNATRIFPLEAVGAMMSNLTTLVGTAAQHPVYSSSVEGIAGYVPVVAGFFARNLGAVKQALPTALFRSVKSASASLANSSICNAQDGRFVVSSIFTTTPTPIGYTYSDLRPAIASVGCLAVMVGIAFDTFILYDPLRNANLYKNSTRLSAVLYYSLATIRRATNLANDPSDADGGLFDVYAVGGFNSSLFTSTVSSNTSLTMMVRRMQIQVSCGYRGTMWNVTEPWQDVATTFPPPSRMGHSVISFADSLVVYGGSSSRGVAYRGVFLLNTTLGAWARLADGNYRQGHTAVYYHNTRQGREMMYVFGGSAGGQYKSELDVFDIGAKSWSVASPTIGLAPLSACGVVNGHKLLIYGGMHGSKAIISLSLRTGQVFVNRSLEVDANAPLWCAAMQSRVRNSVWVVSTLPSSTLLHRLTLPVSLTCLPSHNVIESSPNTGCVACPTGTFADDACRSCGAYAQTVDARPTLFCPNYFGATGTVDKQRLIIGVVVPASIVFAVILLTMVYMMTPKEPFAPYRDPRYAPVPGKPCAILKLVIAEAAQLWAANPQAMTSAVEQLVAAIRNLDALYGCHEFVSSGDCMTLTCNDCDAALRWAVHAVQVSELGLATTSRAASVGLLHLRIVLHYGSDPTTSFRDARHAIDAGHCNALPIGLFVSDAFWNALSTLQRDAAEPKSIQTASPLFGLVSGGESRSSTADSSSSSDARGKSIVPPASPQLLSPTTNGDHELPSNPTRHLVAVPINGQHMATLRQVGTRLRRWWGADNRPVVMLKGPFPVAFHATVINPIYTAATTRSSTSGARIETNASPQQPVVATTAAITDDSATTTNQSVSSATVTADTERTITVDFGCSRMTISIDGQYFKQRGVPLTLKRFRYYIVRESGHDRLAASDAQQESTSNSGEQNSSSSPIGTRLRAGNPAAASSECGSASGTTPGDPLSAIREATGWETHPLLTLEVLTPREFVCMERVVERLYQSLLAPLTEDETAVVQEAIAEHLRLYVETDPCSPQRCTDVAMRVLTIMDMLYVKEAVKELTTAALETA